MTITKKFLLSAILLCFALFSTNVAAKESKEPERLLRPYTEARLNNSPSSKAKTDELPDYYSMIDSPTMASTMNNPLTLNEVESLSNTVIKATFLKTLKEEHVLDSFGEPYARFTHSQIEVEDVYQGNVQPGDILELFEPYYIKEVDGKTYLTHHENYYPCEPGKSYIMFLLETSGIEHDSRYGFLPDQKYYAFSWCERSRFPVIDTNARSETDISALSNEDLDLSPNASTGLYKKLYQEAIDKYMKES